MTTRQRIELLHRAYPLLFPRREILRLLRSQLGHVDALDAWFEREGAKVRARPPKSIYHLCAGNLAVSAIVSITHGLVLGAHNGVKLPGDRDNSTARKEILGFIRGLPAPLRRLVETHRTLDAAFLAQADVVIGFGSDPTMASLREQTRWDQKFIAHGHALSLLWLADPNHLTVRQARHCAVDVLTYDQLGCLSPQAIYVPPQTDFDSLGRKLATALESHWQRLKRKPSRPSSVAARINEARDVAHALGHRVWLPPNQHLGWTLLHDPDHEFQPSPLHGVIIIRESAESRLGSALASVSGRISTVGMVGVASRLVEKTLLNLGVSRFCAAGHMQFPPLTWHHDGRATLADLVTWTDAENLK